MSDENKALQRYIFVASVKKRMIQMFSLQSGKFLGECPAHKSGLWCLHAHDSRRFFSGAQDKRIVEWQVEDETKHIVASVAEYTGHNDWIRDLCTVSPNLIASCSDDTFVKLWDTKTRWCKSTTHAEKDKTPITKIVTLGKRSTASVVAGTEGGYIHQFDLKSSKVKCSWPAHVEPKASPITGLVYSATRRSIIYSCCQYSDVIKVWDARLPLKSDAKPIAKLVSHTNEIWDLNFQNGHLYTAAQDGSIKEWNAQFENSRTWKEAHKGHTVYCLHKLSRDYFLSGGDDNRVRKWNLKTGKLVQKWKCSDCPHDIIAF